MMMMMMLLKMMLVMMMMVMMLKDGVRICHYPEVIPVGLLHSGTVKRTLHRIIMRLLELAH